MTKHSCPPSHNSNIPSFYDQRFADLRREMARLNLGAYLLPRANVFLSEEIPRCDNGLEWLTGFTGSFGVCLIEPHQAVVFTDSRYALQVRHEIPSSCHSHILNGNSSLEDEIASHLEKSFSRGEHSSRVLGYDPWLISYHQSLALDAVSQAKGFSLAPHDLLQAVWTDRPPSPSAPLFLHPLSFSGETIDQKWHRLGAFLPDRTLYLLTSLDSIAWLFNLRGRDVEHTPLAKARALLGPWTPSPLIPPSNHSLLHPSTFKASLFLERTDLPEDLAFTLSSAGVALFPMTEFEPALISLPHHGFSLHCDFKATPAAIAHLYSSGQKTHSQETVPSFSSKQDPCLSPKAMKNPVEQEGARQAHRRDGLAMIRFLAWLDRHMAQDGSLDERTAAEKLLTFREKIGKMWHGPSFATIAASGPNGAFPHYHPTENTNRTFGREDVFLLDSGGQYLDGTTDITRTVVFSPPSPAYMIAYTAVLKGLIALSKVHFPPLTTGGQLDALARAPLWALGLDFGHGTGHGIGSFLSVHEGPQRFSKKDQTALVPGMLLSNEPAYYHSGHFGIRLENVLLVRETEITPPTTPEAESTTILSFETLTLCPFQRASMDLASLSPEEIVWLNTYHRRIWEVFSPLSPSDLPEEDRLWLFEATSPLG